MEKCKFIAADSSILKKKTMNSFGKWLLESFDYETHNHNDYYLIDEMVAKLLPNVLWVRHKRRSECLRNGM